MNTIIFFILLVYYSHCFKEIHFVSCFRQCQVATAWIASSHNANLRRLALRNQSPNQRFFGGLEGRCAFLPEGTVEKIRRSPPGRVIKPVVNNGRNYQPQLVLPGFQPSTVSHPASIFQLPKLSTFVESRLYIDGIDTVDGSEIWRSPVEVGSFSHYLQGFTSQVVQDFFHQQYHSMLYFN